VVVVAALAATYVSVGVNISVGLNIATAINVVATASIPASGSGGARQPSTSTSDDLRKQIQESLIPALSDESYSTLLSAAKLAAARGDKTLYGETLKEAIKREVDSVLFAAEELELIHIFPDHRSDLLEVATNYVAAHIGLP
jgi:hypothetical protein